MQKYDVIIPVAGKDAGFIHRVVKYVRKHLIGVECIYIITNESYVKKIAKSIGRLDDIHIVDENRLIEGLTISHIKDIARRYTNCTSPGWFYQQFLKLGFALTKYAKKYYLSWDADTIPVSDISFFEESQPLFTRKNEYNENYFATIEKIIGLNKVEPYSFIAEHMLFDSDIVRELLKKIETCPVEGNTWFEKIMRAGDYNHPNPSFSEFETYGTYVMTYYPNLYKTRQLNTFRRGGWIRGRAISDQMLEKLSFDLDTISFEMRDEPLFPYNISYRWWRLKDLSSKFFNNNPRVVFKKIFSK